MRSILLTIDRAAYHMRPIRSLSRKQRALAHEALQRGLLRRLPSSGRWPMRYAVSTRGSHYLETFT